MRHICVGQGFIGSMRLFPRFTLLSHRFTQLSIRTLCTPASKPPDPRPPTGEADITPLQRWKEVGKTVGRSSMQKVSTTAKNWWDRYEEFVGLVEVREAQGKVTEAEKDFMVARGIVREARESLEAQQIKLKEIRDRLDRVSRDDVQYLELATLEHKLLQEEKRLRTSYIQAEDTEREKFALFSASVRESHEKERTRAERTKNWSVMGSVLGAVIGVMGSTYINRVRLQELKNLLLEAQKGPISLQEAIHQHASVHHSQQKDLGELILSLRNVVPTTVPSSQELQGGEPVALVSAAGTGDQILTLIQEHMTYTKETGKHLESLHQQCCNLEKSISKVATDVQNVKVKVPIQTSDRPIGTYIPEDMEGGVPLQDIVIFGLADTEQRLGTQINRNSIYSTALTCTMVALTLPIMYILLKGN
ncbi:mitochondrial potassium channel [Hyperolius riggenbachi]|uniref:mitochondrial potassium channel n=1 Tax=Hyperolius riggenbachi TaxID=752182 RepID=UPI0035A31AAA